MVVHGTLQAGPISSTTLAEPIGSKAAVERAAEHIGKILTRDAKISDRDLHDRLRCHLRK